MRPALFAAAVLATLQVAPAAAQETAPAQTPACPGPDAINPASAHAKPGTSSSACTGSCTR